jgi:hypothetical protein
MIMSGIDPDTKKFTEPPEQLKEQIASVSIPGPPSGLPRVSLQLWMEHVLADTLIRHQRHKNHPLPLLRL